ncbi:MAG TPA: FUSC family membrane protein, partial [Myxococcaceae bacterium]|nr:FUSC family membrane protein [Myxococcaceae bacterium]
MNVRVPGLKTRWSWVELQALGPDLATGLRAALVTVTPLVFSVQLARPELGWMAFGGWLGTLADPGGSRGRRARVLVAFVAIGALLVWGGQHIASLPEVAIPTFAAIAGAASLLRAFGPAAGGLGTILAIVAAISTAVPSPDATRHALWFGAGGVVALVLSSTLWPVWTHLPVRRALARVHEELAAYADAQADSVAGGHSAAEHWTSLARTHPRRIRDAIEQARAMSLAVRARRFGESVMGSNLRVLLGLAEAQFLLLVTLATELERLPALPEAVAMLRHLSRRYGEVRSVLVARAWRTPYEEPEPPAASTVADPAGLLRLLERDSAKSLLVVGALGQERPPAPAQTSPPSPSPVAADTVRLRDVLSPSSPIFRHAVRVTVAAAAAATLGAWLTPSHAAWASITTVAV